MPSSVSSKLPVPSLQEPSCAPVRTDSATGHGRRWWRILPLGVLGLGVCGLSLVAWTVSGRWVPEALVFGLSPALVALVRGGAGRSPVDAG